MQQQVLLLATSFSHPARRYLQHFELDLEDLGAKAIGFGKVVDIDELERDKSSFQFDIILYDEHQIPNPEQANRLNSLLASSPVLHFIGHRMNLPEFERWADRLSGGQYFSRYERSINGLCFEFLTEAARHWAGGNQALYDRALADFFERSRQISIELCKLKILNEWDADYLTHHQQEVTTLFQGELAWQLLDDHFPDTQSFLERIARAPVVEQMMYEKIRLAEYFFMQ